MLPALVHGKGGGGGEAKPQREKDAEHESLINGETATGKQCRRFTNRKDKQTGTAQQRSLLYTPEPGGKSSRYDHSERIHAETHAEFQRGKAVVLLHNERRGSDVGEKCSLGEPKLQHITHVGTVSQ